MAIYFTSFREHEKFVGSQEPIMIFDTSAAL